MGLYDAINAYIERGDEVLVIEPTWVSFRQQVELAEGTPVAVPLSEEEEYFLTYDGLKEYVTPQTKMVIINNPNNPTGRVYTRQELEAVAQVAQENDLLVVCDETYEYFTYDSNRHLTLAVLDGMAERTLTSYTFTKAYAMAGWAARLHRGPGGPVGAAAENPGTDGQLRFPLCAAGRRRRFAGAAGPPGAVARGLQRAAYPGRRPTVPGFPASIAPCPRERLSFSPATRLTYPRQNWPSCWWNGRAW